MIARRSLVLAFTHFSSASSLRLPPLQPFSPQLAFLSSLSYPFRALNSSVRYYHSRPKQTCPSCSKPFPSPLPACTNCGHISTLPQDIKYHDIFALPYEPNPFIIDIPTLKQRFREVQTVCHPDTWTSKGLNQQAIAQSLSARINEAYQSLLNPLPRAEYLLRRHNILVSETDQLEDLELMAEVIDARETIEDANDPNEINALMENNQALIQNTVERLEILVGNQQWEEVKAKTIRLRYLESISRAAKKWLDNH